MVSEHKCGVETSGRAGVDASLEWKATATLRLVKWNVSRHYNDD